MLELLSRYWWTILLRGLAAIAFGLIAWLLPGISLAVLVLVFGAYVLVDGILSLISAFSKKSQVENRCSPGSSASWVCFSVCSPSSGHGAGCLARDPLLPAQIAETG